MNKPKVYLIPTFLGAETDMAQTFPEGNLKVISSLNHFAVENLRDSRRFLARIGVRNLIDQSEFYELDKTTTAAELEPCLQALKSGHSIGILSDAGCPGIADPGAVLVALAHKYNYQVVPLIGPSSILLALMASGFNGQSFAFNGYLNRDKQERIKDIKRLEKKAQQEDQTQLFMETPYRNEALWNDLIQHLTPKTQLCVAINVSLKQEFIQTKTVAEWKKAATPHLQKQPAIFLISA